MKKRSKRLVIHKETLRLLEVGLDELRKVDGAITFTCPQITCESRCHTECFPQCA